MAKGAIVAGSLNDGLCPQQNAVGKQAGEWTPYDVERKVVKEDEGPGLTDLPGAQAIWRGVAAKQGCCRKSPTSLQDRQSQGASFIAVGLGAVVQNRSGVQNVAIDGDRF
jgi:hypothetical protein